MQIAFASDIVALFCLNEITGLEFIDCNAMQSRPPKTHRSLNVANGLESSPPHTPCPHAGIASPSGPSVNPGEHREPRSLGLTLGSAMLSFSAGMGSEGGHISMPQALLPFCWFQASLAAFALP